jgi:phage FluMu protein Com
MDLKEYHCKVCGKLLCKGNLVDKDSLLEVKCRGCHTVSVFQGPDAEIIRKRSVLIKAGLIPDPEISPKTQQSPES